MGCCSVVLTNRVESTNEVDMRNGTFKFVVVSFGTELLITTEPLTGGKLGLSVSSTTFGVDRGAVLLAGKLVTDDVTHVIDESFSLAAIYY